MPVPRSAHSASLLQQRVAALRRTLPGVRKGDEGAVHQARVATRRLREVLPLVAAGKPGRRMERLARHLTRALGPIRELDVELLMLGELERAGDVPAAAIAYLRRAINDRRRALHRDAVKQVDALDVDTLQRKALRVVERNDAGRKGAEHRQEQVAAARRRAARRATRLETAMEVAGAMYLPDRLHQVRIAVKKLRYALEIARDLSGSRAEARIRSLRRIQDLLGRMHDIDVLVARTRAFQAAAVRDLRLSSDLDQLVRRLETEARQLHGEYITTRRTLLDICNRVIATGETQRAA